jgi:hypothetical protein
VLAYAMEVSTADQVAAQDPFGGRGLFLPMDAGGEEILGAVQETFGSVPAIAWPGRGAWVIPQSPEEAWQALALWEAR